MLARLKPLLTMLSMDLNGIEPHARAWTYQRVLEGAWGFDRLYRPEGRHGRLAVHVHAAFEGPPFWHTHSQALAVVLLSHDARYELRVRSGTDLPEVRMVARGVFSYEMAPESQHAVRVLPGGGLVYTVCLFDLLDAKLGPDPAVVDMSFTSAERLIGAIDRAMDKAKAL